MASAAKSVSSTVLLFLQGQREKGRKEGGGTQWHQPGQLLDTPSSGCSSRLPPDFSELAQTALSKVVLAWVH